MTPEEEIIELKAKTASLESQIALVKKNLQIKDISEEELSEFKNRISHLEAQLSSLKHTIDTKNITTNPDYPPYIPWTTPSPVESLFSPAKWQKIPSSK
jgi:hypothetical protein